MKNQGFGTGMDVVWSQGGDFALRDENVIKIIKS